MIIHETENFELTRINQEMELPAFIIIDKKHDMPVDRMDAVIKAFKDKSGKVRILLSCHGDFFFAHKSELEELKAKANDNYKKYPNNWIFGDRR